MSRVYGAPSGKLGGDRSISFSLQAAPAQASQTRDRFPLIEPCDPWLSQLLPLLAKFSNRHLPLQLMICRGSSVCAPFDQVLKYLRDAACLTLLLEAGAAVLGRASLRLEGLAVDSPLTGNAEAKGCSLQLHLTSAGNTFTVVQQLTFWFLILSSQITPSKGRTCKVCST